MGTFLLIGALGAILGAQAPSPGRGLPWQGASELPWRACEASPLPPPLPPDAPAPPVSARRIVSLTSHGVLRIVNERGLVILRLGLPGRPLRIWRDGGTPVELSAFPMDFPSATPLSGGVGNIPVTGLDFRPVLKGLLWILDDGGQRVTVIHPATGQVIYLDLPGGRDLDLRMYPDRLELRETAPEAKDRRETLGWSVPWMAFFPQLLQLSAAPSEQRRGTALAPFSGED